MENAIRRRGKADEARRLLRGLYEAALVGCDLAYALRARAATKFGDVVRQSDEKRDRDGLVVRSGARGAALDFLRNWVSQYVVGYLKICDPYFGPGDLEALQLVLACAPKALVSILTSKKHQDNQRSEFPIEELYRREWLRLSDQAPPNNEVVVVGTTSGDLPIHDRWWITQGHGLRVGTSFNSLGGKRESEISILADQEITK